MNIAVNTGKVASSFYFIDIIVSMKNPFLWQLLSVALLSGCTVNPNDGKPEFLTNAPRLTLEGRQGFMPGQKLRFGQYHGGVNKSWVNAAGLGFLVSTLADDKLQSVKVRIQNADNQSVSINYLQSCSWDLASVLIDGISRPTDFKGKIHVNNTLTSFSEPTKIPYKKQWFNVDISYLQSDHRYTVTLANKVVAEARLQVYVGGMSNEDYVWIDQTQPEDIKLMAATLIAYAVTYETPDCKS
ncbi:hypothetical protein [Vibrio salinus]|uniref:hypothetical protein n=1 Tax=Vibrio salinus TaxID=2899784 RepID=UPI001E33AB65|nr:hypothetical protein [Vibrio salinus]MCE0495198.1 hypothetical protein [Vibrio salinus]